MNCKETQKVMIDYLFNDNIVQEFKNHLEHCPTCCKEFEQMKYVVQKLKPNIEIKTSSNFINNTIQKLNMEDKKMKKKIPFWSKVAAAILLGVAVTSLFTVFSDRNTNNNVSACPANQIFAQSLIALSKSKSMCIEMKIRTLEGDNFELIGTKYGFVKHKIKVEFSSPKKWVIQKPKRTVVCDGKNQYLDIQIFDFVIKGDVNCGFVGWLQILLTPEKILEIEKEQSEKYKSNYTVKETKKQLILTVYNKAQGDYTNDYLKNSSIWDSDNKRVFCFDKKTHQLLSFKLYIIENNKETLVMKTTKITFNEDYFDASILSNKPIKDAEDFTPKQDEEIKNKTPEEIARYFFEACAANDWKKVEVVDPYINSKMKEHLGGLQIVEIGKSFKSGSYRGYFVPYTIKLKSGHTKKHNLAVRNDNPEKIWTIDGGI